MRCLCNIAESTGQRKAQLPVKGNRKLKHARPDQGCPDRAGLPWQRMLHLQITLWTGARHAHRLLVRRVQLSSCRHHTAGACCKLGRSRRVVLRRCCCTWVCRLPAVLRGAISCARADSLGGHCLSGSQAAGGQALCPFHTLIASGESPQDSGTCYTCVQVL
jgi:hypothetical protein